MVCFKKITVCLCVALLSFPHLGFRYLAPAPVVWRTEELQLQGASQRACLDLNGTLCWLRKRDDNRVELFVKGREGGCQPVGARQTINDCVITDEGEGRVRVVGPQTYSAGVVVFPKEKVGRFFEHSFGSVGVFQRGNHGGDESSEDSVAVSADGNIVALADGVGSNDDSAYTKLFSQYLVDKFVVLMEKNPFLTLKDIFVQHYNAVAKAFNAAHLEGRASTTLVLVRVQNNVAEVLNIGDSAVLIYDSRGQLVAQTTDVSLSLNGPLQLKNQEEEVEALLSVGEALAREYAAFPDTGQKRLVSGNLCHQFIPLKPGYSVVVTSDAAKDNLYPQEMGLELQKKRSAFATAKAIGEKTHALGAGTLKSSFGIVPFYLEKAAEWMTMSPKHLWKQKFDLSEVDPDVWTFLQAQNLVSIEHTSVYSDLQRVQNLRVKPDALAQGVDVFRTWGFTAQEVQKMEALIREMIRVQQDMAQLIQEIEGNPRHLFTAQQRKLIDDAESLQRKLRDEVSLLINAYRQKITQDMAKYGWKDEYRKKYPLLDEEKAKARLQKIDEFELWVKEHAKEWREKDKEYQGIVEQQRRLVMGGATAEQYRQLNQRKDALEAEQKTTFNHFEPYEDEGINRFLKETIGYARDRTQGRDLFEAVLAKPKETLLKDPRNWPYLPFQESHLKASVQDLADDVWSKLFESEEKKSWQYCVPHVSMDVFLKKLEERFGADKTKKIMKILWGASWESGKGYNFAQAKPDDISVVVFRPEEQRQSAVYDLRAGKELRLTIDGVPVLISKVEGKGFRIQNAKDREKRMWLDKAEEQRGILPEDDFQRLRKIGFKAQVEKDQEGLETNRVYLSYNPGFDVHVEEVLPEAMKRSLSRLQQITLFIYIGDQEIQCPFPVGSGLDLTALASNGWKFFLNGEESAISAQDLKTKDLREDGVIKLKKNNPSLAEMSLCQSLLQSA